MLNGAEGEPAKNVTHRAKGTEADIRALTEHADTVAA